MLLLLFSPIVATFMNFPARTDVLHNRNRLELIKPVPNKLIKVMANIVAESAFLSSLKHRLTGILQRYETHIEAEKEISTEIPVAEPVKYSSMTTGELLQETERRLKENNADGLTVTDLIHLENELQTAVMQIRSRKTHLMLESVEDLHEKEKLLHKEKKHLEKNRARMKKNRSLSDLPLQITVIMSKIIVNDKGYT